MRSDLLYTLRRYEPIIGHPRGPGGIRAPELELNVDERVKTRKKQSAPAQAREVKTVAVSHSVSAGMIGVLWNTRTVLNFYMFLYVSIFYPTYANPMALCIVRNVQSADDPGMILSRVLVRNHINPACTARVRQSLRSRRRALKRRFSVKRTWLSASSNSEVRSELCRRREVRP